MKKIWERFESWIEQNAGHLKLLLAPAATENDFQKLESQIRLTLPTSFKEFYSVHNGQLQETQRLIDGEILLSLDRISGEWNVWNDLLDEFQDEDGIYTSDPDPGVKNDWWNPKWVPITSNHCGDNICIDFDPDVGGTYGQIITMIHDGGWRSILAHSFEAWMEKYVTDLENGIYVYDPGFGIADKNFL